MSTFTLPFLATPHAWFEPFFAAHGWAIVVFEATQFTQYVFLYVASTRRRECGGGRVGGFRKTTAKGSFFDEDVSQRMREDFLPQSSVVVEGIGQCRVRR